MARQTGVKGLQLWCKNVTQGYKGVEITNMNKSFRDGLAFCAIIHRFRPDLIPFDTLKKGDTARNNTLAFKVAEEELDIVALLDVEDMVEMEIPDKLSIATYLISYYNYFKDMQPATSKNTINVSKSASNITSPAPQQQATPTNTQQHNGLPINTAKQNMPPASGNQTEPPGREQRPSPLQVQRPNPLPILKFNRPPLTKTVSSPVVPKENAVLKLSEGLMKLQKNESTGLPSHPRPMATPSSPAKRGMISAKSVDSTPFSAPSSPTKSVTRGRKQKFGNAEPVVIGTDNLKTAKEGPPPKPPSRRKSEKRNSGVIEMCEMCNQRVFLMQRLNAEGHVYHRQCFKCARCNVALQSKSYEYDIQDDMFFCRTHYREVNRQKSIKRTMQARGITSFDENDLPSKFGGVAKDKEPEDEWDIIPTPPPTKTEAPPLAELIDQKHHDDQMKKELPGLLSALAQKKRHGILNKEQPTQDRPHPLPSIDEKKGKTALIPGMKSDKEETKMKEERVTVTSKEKHPATADTDQVKEQLKKGPTGKDESPKTGRNKQTPNKVPPPPRPPPPSVEHTPSHQSKGPTKPVRTGNKELTTKMLKNYEFGQKYLEENNEAREIIRERYEMADTTRNKKDKKDVLLVEPEGQPYEVPFTKVRSKTELQAATPNKPPRHKNNKPGFVTIHKGDTWVKPYAVTPLDSCCNQATGDSKEEQVKLVKPKLKPVRPAPPLPHGVKPKPRTTQQKSVSPYAVSNVKGVASAKNELRRKRQRALKEHKQQLELVEKEQNALERRGVELEQTIRSSEEDIELDDQMMEEWFALVNQKDQLVRRESELVYLIRDIELIEQREQLDAELRRRLDKDELSKTELEKVEEEAMMEELVQLVMRRDQLMWQFDEDKNREEECEQSITRAMTMMKS